MGWIGGGVLAFILFWLYDVSSMTGRYRLFRPGFFIGCALLLVSSAGLIAQAMIDRAPAWRLLWGLPALACLALLIYTLFFALPFSDTYRETGGRPALCRDGVYALCRHPGVLWLAGFYLFLWAALGTWEAGAAFLVFTLLDVGYAAFQDKVTFMRLFDDYGEYKKTTPFLLPTADSVQRCLHTIAHK